MQDQKVNATFLRMREKDTRWDSHLIGGVALSWGPKFNSEYHSFKKDSNIPE